MIICDVDNIAGRLARPPQQAIDEECRKQAEALKDVRRRLRVSIGPRAVASVTARA